MKLYSYSCIFLVSLFLGGCFQIPSQKKPVTVAPESKLSGYSQEAFATAYGVYAGHLAKGDAVSLALATQQRDIMVQRIRVDIDAWYSHLEEDLFEKRASFNTWADVAELMLTGAATISNGVRDKTVLAAILSAGKGSRLSYDKNWFREKTTEVLMTAMRAERAKVLLAINGKMSNSNARQYTFEEAWADLIAYFQAGTLQGGLLALSTQTGQQAAMAQNAVEKQNAERAQALKNAPETAIALRESITAHLAKLSPNGARAVLKELKISIPTTNAPTELRELIRTYQEGIDASDEAGLKNLFATIKKNEDSP